MQGLILRRISSRLRARAMKDSATMGLVYTSRRNGLVINDPFQGSRRFNMRQVPPHRQPGTQQAQQSTAGHKRQYNVETETA